MSGETDLNTLLTGLSPSLDPGRYYFCTLAGGDVPAGLSPRMVFHEAEGVTLIVTDSEAKAHALPVQFPCRMITLNVHSSLEAVGMIARVAMALAGAGMGVNPVSGYYHDHLFVPADRAEDAMTTLAALVQDARDTAS